MTANAWDAASYDTEFGFVSALAGDLVDMLDPRPGERVLDLGCGTGTLTARLASTGATVLGVDADATMVSRAREQHPGIEFAIADAHDLRVAEPFDAAFSNAALHWMPRPDEVLGRVHAALRPGGRFVAEMGGARNIATIRAAVAQARAEYAAGGCPDPWYFPTPAEYAARLERAGFVVRGLWYVDRPTPLAESGVLGWLGMFGDPLLGGLDAERRQQVAERAAELCRRALLRPDGWYADYVRLRFHAVRT